MSKEKAAEEYYYRHFNWKYDSVLKDEIEEAVEYGWEACEKASTSDLLSSQMKAMEEASYQLEELEKTNQQLKDAHMKLLIEHEAFKKKAAKCVAVHASLLTDRSRLCSEEEALMLIMEQEV